MVQLQPMPYNEKAYKKIHVMELFNKAHTQFKLIHML